MFNKNDRLMSDDAWALIECRKHIAELRAALRSVVDHWNEFGPGNGLDEKMEQAHKVLYPPTNDHACPVEFT